MRDRRYQSRHIGSIRHCESNCLCRFINNTGRCRGRKIKCSNRLCRVRPNAYRNRVSLSRTISSSDRVSNRTAEVLRNPAGRCDAGAGMRDRRCQSRHIGAIRHCESNCFSRFVNNAGYSGVGKTKGRDRFGCRKNRRENCPFDRVGDDFIVRVFDAQCE